MFDREISGISNAIKSKILRCNLHVICCPFVAFIDSFDQFSINIMNLALLTFYLTFLMSVFSQDYAGEARRGGATSGRRRNYR